MKARPILFSTPMVQAILAGRKTQTRRIVKGWHLNALMEDGFTPEFVADDGNNPPYGKRGDLLYVRESICRAQEYGGIGYVADTTWYPNYAWPWKKDVLPSIHMPRGLSRLTLEIIDVRVERLHDISEEDAKAEGCSAERWYTHPTEGPVKDTGGWVASTRYKELWETINGPGSWDANPWVWVLTFKVHKQNVDQFIGGGA